MLLVWNFIISLKMKCFFFPLRMAWKPMTLFCTIFLIRHCLLPACLPAWLAVSVEPFVLNTTCTHDMRIKNVRMVENVIEMLRRKSTGGGRRRRRRCKGEWDGGGVCLGPGGRGGGGEAKDSFVVVIQNAEIDLCDDLCGPIFSNGGWSRSLGRHSGGRASELAFRNLFQPTLAVN